MTNKPETVREEDLIQRKDSLYYKKYAKVAFTGISEEFSENGQLEVRGNYKNGQREGLHESFHEKGQLSFRTNYKNGKREGLHEGYSNFTRLSLRENLLLRENYKNGKRDGLTEIYIKGQLKIRKTYVDGHLKMKQLNYSTRKQISIFLTKGGNG